MQRVFSGLRVLLDCIEMSDNRGPLEDIDLGADNDLASLSKHDADDYSRRDALRALGKFSAYVGTTGVVVLSAEQAVAQSTLATCFNQCDTNFSGQPIRRFLCRRRCRRQDQINQDVNG